MRLGGLAERKTYFNSVKKENDNTVFLDSGDMLSLRSSINDDEIVSAVYPEMGYDACAVGDQELINGVGFFKENLSREMDFVSGNLSFTDQDIKIKKYKIIETADSLKVGVTAVNYNTGFRYLMRKGTISEEDIVVDKAFDNLRDVLGQMKPLCDLIVIMSHLNNEGTVKLLDRVEGYDLLIGGHTGYSFVYPRKVRNAVYVSNGRDGEKVGKVVYSLNDTGRMKFESYELIEINADETDRDPAIEKIIQEVE